MDIEQFIKNKDFDSAFTAMKAKKYANIEFIEADYKNEKKIKDWELVPESDWVQYETMVGDLLLLMISNEEFEYKLLPDVKWLNRKKPVVFISYAGVNKPEALKVCGFLQEKGITPRIDEYHKTTTEKVNEFVIRELKAADYGILLVSLDALASGWVGIEIDGLLFKEKMDNAKLLLLSLDGNQLNGGSFYFDILARIREKIRHLEKQRDKAIKLGQRINPFQNSLNMMYALDARISELYVAFAEKGNITDVTEKNFEQGMLKIIEDIHADFRKRK